jgi:hypothetical protein
MHRGLGSGIDVQRREEPLQMIGAVFEQLASGGAMDQATARDSTT